MAISVRRSAATTNRGDAVFRGLTFAFAAIVVLIVIGFAGVLLVNSIPSIQKNGASFLTTYDWSVNEETGAASFGALNFIYATIVTSVIALIIGGLISLGSAIFLSEYAPAWLRTPLSFTIELLAAIPSIIYGFWGVQVLATTMGGSVDPFLNGVLGFLPAFGGNKSTGVQDFGAYVGPTPTGRDILTASLVLAIMIIPTITSISRDVLRTVPNDQREGLMALGATRWQTISRVVLPAARRGIVGAIILGFGRAVGETVAVAYLIGGALAGVGPKASVFARSETIASKIANSYAEISGKDSYSALIQLGLVLFILTFFINIAAQALVNRQQKTRGRDTKTGAQVPIWQRYIGWVIFPAIMLLFSPYLSLTVSLIIIAIWLILRVAARYAAASEAKGRPIPGAIIFNPSGSYSFRKAVNSIMTVVLTSAVVIAIIPLASILILVIVNGLQAVFTAGFLTNDLLGRPVFGDGTPGASGIGHAIIGTLLMVAIGSVIGIPLGLLAGIYLSEFGNGRFGTVVRFTADILQGIPSIIVGLVAYTLIVAPRFFADPSVTSPYNAIAGGIALAVMMVPIISRTTEEILRLVPGSLREAGLALGVPQWRVTLTVILPAAISGVTTGVILGVARIAGETAPLLLTARGNNRFPGSVNQETPSLTLYMFTQSKGLPDQVRGSWGAAFVLVLLILVLIFTARYFTRSKLGGGR